MMDTFYYLEQIEDGYRINLTDFSGSTILFGKQLASKFDHKKQLQSMKTHLCFQSNYCRINNFGGTYSFEVRTCWDDLIAESISFATKQERELAMEEIFNCNKKAEWREIALYPYQANATRLYLAS